MLLGNTVKNVFISGGAGFIGSHLADTLLAEGYKVTVYDNLSNGQKTFIDQHLTNNNFSFILGDLRDLPLLKQSVKGHDLVWHLASNTDIIGCHTKPERDLEDGVQATFNMVEAMRLNGITDILFSSSGAVYGDLCADKAVDETAGPLIPVSTYAASKIGSEAFISSYCYLYGLRAWIFRFGNVVGARMTHGAIFDFIAKLRKNSKEIQLRGDGRQEKNYFLVKECIEGMTFAYRNVDMTEEKPCDIFNLGTGSVTRVINMVNIIKQEMGFPEATIKITGGIRAWPGDQPRVHISVDKLQKLGWTAKFSSDESVKLATQRMLKND